MKRLALTNRYAVEANGLEYRLLKDMKQLGLSLSDFGVDKIGDITRSLEGFTDHGLVSWDGIELYMSTYEAPILYVDHDDFD